MACNHGGMFLYFLHSGDWISMDNHGLEGWCVGNGEENRDWRYTRIPAAHALLAQGAHPYTSGECGSEALGVTRAGVHSQSAFKVAHLAAGGL